MNVMVTEIYDALMSAGADEEKARRAAETLATSDAERKRQFADLREDNQKMRTEMAELRGETKSQMVALRGELKAEIAALRGELTLIKWMMGVVIAIGVGVFIRVLFL